MKDGSFSGIPRKDSWWGQLPREAWRTFLEDFSRYRNAKEHIAVLKRQYGINKISSSAYYRAKSWFLNYFDGEKQRQTNQDNDTSNGARRWFYPGHDPAAVVRILKSKSGIDLQDHEADRILRLYAFMQQEFDDCRHPGTAQVIRIAVNKASDMFALEYETELGLVKDLDVLVKVGLLVAEDLNSGNKKKGQNNA